MKLKFLICTLAYLLIGMFVKAQTINQDVIASDGNFSVSSSGSLSWTIGESIVDTYNGSTNTLTKGFHQLLKVYAIPEDNSLGNVFLYPNPVKDILQFEFSKMPEGVYSIEMYDVAGKLLSRSKVLVDSDSFQSSLSLSQYAEGFYLVKITNDTSASSKFFKITKQ